MNGSRTWPLQIGKTATMVLASSLGNGLLCRFSWAPSWPHRDIPALQIFTGYMPVGNHVQVFAGMCLSRFFRKWVLDAGRLRDSRTAHTLRLSPFAHPSRAMYIKTHVLNSRFRSNQSFHRQLPPSGKPSNVPTCQTHMLARKSRHGVGKLVSLGTYGAQCVLVHFT